MVSTAPSARSEQSLYDRVGGDEFFESLVALFYEGVATDEVLAPMYPEYPDLSGAGVRLREFLIQYWGGPDRYSQHRGHPRLRMRHFPFHIGPLERDRWLVHMVGAVDQMHADGAMSDDIRAELLNYFIPVAEHMRNDTGLPVTGQGFQVRIEEARDDAADPDA